MTFPVVRRGSGGFHTFEPEIYAQWCGDAGVWLKNGDDPQDAPDENYHAALLHDCCNFAARTECIEKSVASPDSVFNSNNTHLDLSN